MRHPYRDPFSVCILVRMPIHPMKPYKSTPMMLSPCLLFILLLKSTHSFHTRYAIPCYRSLSYLISLPSKTHKIHLQR